MKNLGLDKKASRNFIIALLSMTSYCPYTLIGLLYVPAMSALGLTNTQMSLLISVYSLSSAVFYIITGRLSDNVSPKLCLVLACLGAGGLGLLLSTLPSFPVTVVIFALMPVGCMSWSSCSKCMRMLVHDQSKTGRMYGISSLMDGVVNFILFAGAVIWAGSRIMDPYYYCIVLRIISGFTFACGIIILFFLDFKWIEGQSTLPKGSGIKKSLISSIVEVIKLPDLYLVSCFSIAQYGLNIINNYISPYLIDCYGFPVSNSVLFAIITAYGLKMIMGYAAGQIRDRLGSNARYFKLASSIVIAAMIVLIVLPVKPVLLPVAMVFAGIFTLLYIMCNNSTSYTLAEVNPPVNMYAMMNSLSCIIGTAGSVLTTSVMGPILDSKGSGGYKYMFIFGIGWELFYFFSPALFRFFRSRKNSIIGGNNSQL